ncbi:hypothetical protein niasHT_029842 [Heterodera trifolii]|uniref:Fumarate lyase N-terminal domain-containing protein n=1 Tax=Heterodera trifolii TaxID=157864 RepID=A0ABD2K0V9_9BILA
MDSCKSIFAERWCRKSPLLHLFSPAKKVSLSYQLWNWLVESESELGLDVGEQSGTEMEREPRIVEEAAWLRSPRDRKNRGEKVQALKMEHIESFFETSCFLRDNVDLIIQREALDYLIKRLAICLKHLANFARENAKHPTVGRTHLQKASLVTIGKRAVLWADGLLNASKKLRQVRADLRFRGVMDAIAIQDPLVGLFNITDLERAEQFDAAFAQKAGFGDKVFTFCDGTAYPRYHDSHLGFALASLSSAASKFAFDLRILQSHDEMSEQFGDGQVGSSAMPQKRNPLHSERICGISNFEMLPQMVCALDAHADGLMRMSNNTGTQFTMQQQAFLAADAILSTLLAVIPKMGVNYGVVNDNVANSYAFLERAKMMLTRSLDNNQQEAHAFINDIFRGNVQNREDVLAQFPEDICAALDHLIANPILLCGRSVEIVRDFLDNELQEAISDVTEEDMKPEELDV